MHRISQGVEVTRSSEHESARCIREGKQVDCKRLQVGRDGYVDGLGVGYGSKLPGTRIEEFPPPPHYFRVCRREDIGMSIVDQGHSGNAERQVQVIDFPNPIPKSPDDVFVVIKQHLASTRVHQVILCSSCGA